MDNPEGELPLDNPAAPTPLEVEATEAEYVDDDLTRDPVEVLAAEFVDRHRGGECPSIDEYAEKYPQWADQIQDLFPTIAAMERLKVQQQRSSDGRASLGPDRIERLGDFRIVREIGRGGMGIVFEAEQESLGRHVAVKVLPRQSLLDEKHLKRFQREARTAANLHHTNIVPVFGVGEQDGFHYLVMQFIRGVGLDAILAWLQDSDVNRVSRKHPDSSSSERAVNVGSIAESLIQGEFQPILEAGSATNGESGLQHANDGDSAVDTDRQILSDVPTETHDHDGSECSPDVEVQGGAVQGEAIQEDGVLHQDVSYPKALQSTNPYWQSVAQVGVQVANALQFAHAQGTLHRDIKPANLLLDAHGVAWVADFGLAKAIEQDAVTQSGDIVGTLRYMAPEQFSGHSDARSDIYSLGLTLYELLTLKPAYDEANRSGMIRRITEGELSRPGKLRAGIPRDLETIVMKAVARDPNHRYSTAGELAEDLQRYLDDRPILARRATPIETLWRWSRRNKAVASLAGATLALSMLVAAVATGGYFRTKTALHGEQLQRAKADELRTKAEETLEISFEALDNVYQRFAPDRTARSSSVTWEAETGEEVEVAQQAVLSQQAADLLEDILPFYDRLAAQDAGSIKSGEEAAKANRRVGDIRQRLGQMEGAEEAYRRAIAKYEKLSTSSNASDRFVAEVARIHNELGNVYRTMGRRDDAHKAHSHALEKLTPLASSVDSSIRFELARTNYFLGRRGYDFGRRRRGPRGGGTPDRPRRPTSPGEGPPPPIDERSGRRPELRGPRPGSRDRRSGRENEHLEKATEILTELQSEQPAAGDYRYLLALCYRDRGRGTSLDELERAIGILEPLCSDFPDAADYRHELNETYVRWSRRAPLDDAENVQTAMRRIEIAVKYADELVDQNPNIADYAASRARVYYYLGDLLVRRAIRDEEQVDESLLQRAEEQFQTAETIQHSLIERFPKVPRYKFWMVMMFGQRAWNLDGRGRLQEASDLLGRSATQLEQWLKQDPEASFFNRALGFTYGKIQKIEEKMGHDEAAAEAARLADEHMQASPGRPSFWPGRRDHPEGRRRGRHGPRHEGPPRNDGVE